MKRKSGRVLVVGSLNIDYIAGVHTLPRPGETVSGLSLAQKFGGKGANQAVAAARQGASVSMIGAVGEDPQGQAYLARLREESIDSAGVRAVPGVVTGSALIAVDSQGENTIIVAPGANGTLSPKDVRKHRKLIESVDVLLLQLEVPADAALEAIRLANRASVRAVLNPSPFPKTFPWGDFALDTLIVNEGEAQELFGSINPAKRVFAALSAWRIKCLLVTRGSKETLCFMEKQVLRVPTLSVTPIDTVGAGDAFAGAYAAWSAARSDIITATRMANVAGALTALKTGAQEAIPNRTKTVRTERLQKSSP